MPRPLRDTDPSKVHLLTCRTLRAELLLVPRPALTECVAGVIARYQEAFNIELYAACVLSNHYHLLSQAPEGQLALFAENINREIALRVNRMIGREGTFWGRRYDDQITIEQYDAVDGLLYVLTNPTKHGLVAHPKSWPGVSTYWQTLGAKDRVYAFTHYTEYHKAKRSAERWGEYVSISDYQTQHTLRVSPLPYFKRLSDRERIEKLNTLLEARTRKLCRERRAAGKGFLGRKAVLQQPAQGVFPEEVSKSPRPRCRTCNPEARREFIEEEKARVAWYTEASKKYRLGDYEVLFPPYSFRPPLHHVPREHALLPPLFPP